MKDNSVLLISEEIKKLTNSDYEKHLTVLLKCLNDRMEACEDDIDYFGLMVAVGVLNKTATSLFEKNLLEDISNPSDIEDWKNLLNDCVNTKYLSQVKKNGD